MKTFLWRVLPLLLAILLGSILSWVSIYAFWFGVWTFHNVAAARACDWLGSILLLPAREVFVQFGADQTALFFDPVSYSVANGLLIGVVGSICIRAAWGWRRRGVEKGAEAQRAVTGAGRREG